MRNRSISYSLSKTPSIKITVIENDQNSTQPELKRN